MKYLKQFGIILAVTCIGEFLKHVIPLPIPSSIYGLLILFMLLFMKAIRLDQVKEAGEFLIEIMPLMFIPAAAGLITSWGQIRRILIPLCIIIPVSTCVVMLAAGKATDFIIEKKERHLK
ncbi:MAG: CidA/LrgA family protein [Oscillospiraceae bacterium]|nr:CidA/LrgA family protein [Oscillospiraceae bacterium]RKJ57886.1 CidA/LrgA family protein [bacterium 1XD42-8]RKJ66685.1 CidA/LrgA family protein [bacterium 1XD42-1]